MSDSFGRGVAIIFTAIALVFLPLLCLSLHADNMSQSRIENAVITFVDSAKTTGRISSAQYEKMCREIDACEGNCSIEIKHSLQFIVPTDDINHIMYEDKYKDEILKVIYNSDNTENADYKMNQGDILTVTVKNTKPTMSTKLYRLIMPMYNPGGTSIYVIYSGTIANQN